MVFVEYYTLLKPNLLKTILKTPVRLKIFRIFVIHCILLFSDAYSQNLQLIDSLITQLKVTPESEQNLVLIGLAKAYVNNDYEKATTYAEQSIARSKQFGDSIPIGIAHILIGETHITSGQFSRSEEHFMKAKELFSVVKSDENEAWLYGSMGDLYIKSNDNGKAKACFLKSLEIGKKIGNLSTVTWAMNNLVSIYANEGAQELAKKTALEALQAADKLNNDRLKINLHVKLGNILTDNSTIDEAAMHYDKALVLAKKDRNKRAITHILIQKGFMFGTHDLYKDAKKQYQEALQICEEQGYLFYSTYVYTNLGLSSFATGDYDMSLSYFNKGIEVAQKIENKERITTINTCIADVYIQRGDYKKGIQLLYDSLMHYEQKDDQYQLASIYLRIGDAFYQLSEIEAAEEHYQKALKLSEELAEIRLNAGAQLGLGKIDIKQKKYAESISHLTTSFDGYTQVDDIKGIFMYYNQMAEISMQQGETEKALDWMNTVIEKEEELNRFKEIAIESYTRLGDIHIDLAHYEEAISFFKKSLTKSLATNSRKKIKENYYGLSLCYEKLDKSTESLAYYKKYTQLKDSLYSIDKIKEISQIQTKYDTEKKEQRIEFLQKEKKYQSILLNSQNDKLKRMQLEKDLEAGQRKLDIIKLQMIRRKNKINQLHMRDSLQIAEQEIQSNQLEIQKSMLQREALLRNIAIGSSILALLIAFFIIMYYRQRLTTQKLIAKKEIEAITAASKGREKERERIAKELHDGIGGNLAAIKLDLNRITATSDFDLQHVINNIDGTYNEVRALSHHLIPSNVLRNSFEELINNYLLEVSKTSNFEIHNDFYPPAGFNEVSDQLKIELYRITQELINNIIKHSEATRVDLQFTILDDQIKLLIEDNGIGFDAEKTSKGIGLRNITSRAKSMGGTIFIDTMLQRGTIIEIAVPLKSPKTIKKQQGWITQLFQLFTKNRMISFFEGKSA